MRSLLAEYKKSREGIKQMISQLGDSLQDQEDKKILRSMYRDISFVIEWLEKGKNPDDLRGINRRYIYDIIHLKNMDILPDITSQIRHDPIELNDDQRKKLIEIFDALSDRERDCFILHIGQDKSMQKVADELGISKSSVQMYIKRAQKKINEILSYACHTKS